MKVIGPESHASKARKNLASLEITSDSQWYYLDNDGGFLPYAIDINRVIENAFNNGVPSAQFNANGKTYTISFGEGGRTHLQTNPKGIDRTVRRGKDPAQAIFMQNDVVWYWSDDTANSWRRYEPEACNVIEKNYQMFLRKHENATLSLLTIKQREELKDRESVLVWGTSNYSYFIDFVNMVQYNEKFGRWRGIKRGNEAGVFRVSKKEEKWKPPWIPHPILK